MCLYSKCTNVAMAGKVLPSLHLSLSLLPSLARYNRIIFSLHKLVYSQTFLYITQYLYVKSC